MSNILNFPPVEEADSDGLLGIGGDLSPENLLAAYTQGIFPWPWTDEYVAWFSPPKRCVLLFDDLHISQSLKKVLRRNPFEIRFNTAFKQVITACAESLNRGKQNGTWITPSMIKGYTALHKAGYAHCVEAYKEKKLVGGIYGVQIGKYFSGESMFYTEPNASKVALVKLLEKLKNEGSTWMDCQVITPHTKAFGAKEISRNQFLKRLRKSLNQSL